MGTNSTLAIDFGTSNSAVAVIADGEVKHLQMEPGSNTLPTAIFFDFTQKKIRIGSEANTCLTSGMEGRYMRSLKRVLGTSLMPEKRYMMDMHLDFFDIIAGFLRDIKTRAEQIEGTTFHRVLSGRPVHFHDDPSKDRQAEEDLRECYLRAGFTDITFMLEPEAAAHANAVFHQQTALGLIVDIGGGTSDYSVFHARPEQVKSPIEICASYGRRFGGTDFDKTLNTTCFMPKLGKGTQLRKPMGPGTSTAPVALFNDLATWEKIPFLYTPATIRKARDLHRYAIEKEPFSRLVNVLEYELGHELAVIAEQAKITVNQTENPLETIDLGLIGRGRNINITPPQLANMMAPHRAQIINGALETLSLSGVTPSDITDVIFVGGSSLMGFVHSALNEVFPAANQHTTAVFTAVVDGLAVASVAPHSSQGLPASN